MIVLLFINPYRSATSVINFSPNRIYLNMFKKFTKCNETIQGAVIGPIIGIAVVTVIMIIIGQKRA